MRIVKGKQFIGVDYQGNKYEDFRMKEINGYWFGHVRLVTGEYRYCTLRQIDNKSLVDVKEINNG